jgi:hypothetical protein
VLNSISVGSILCAKSRMILYHNPVDINCQNCYALPGDFLINMDLIKINHIAFDIPIFITVGVRFVTKYGIIFSSMYLGEEDFEVVL